MSFLSANPFAEYRESIEIGGGDWEHLLKDLLDCKDWGYIEDGSECFEGGLDEFSVCFSTQLKVESVNCGRVGQ